MSGRKAGESLREIGRGYLRSLRGLLWALALAALALAAGVAIVLPLWYLSTHFRGAYTWCALGLVAGGLAYLAVRRIVERSRRPREIRRAAARRAAGRALTLVVAIVALYLILVLYFIGFLGAAVPLSVLYVVALGYRLYVTRRSSTNGSA